jgi:predicted Zn-dependent protease
MDYASDVYLKLIVIIGVLVWLAAPAGACAYTVETPKWSEEFNNQEAKEATRKAEERKAAEEHKAAEEQKAREEQSQHLASERQQGEEAPQQPGEAAPQCVVPALKGDTLTAARQALRQAHCKLGHVSSPHHAHGVLVVTRQGIRADGEHPVGTAVTLAFAPARHQR